MNFETILLEKKDRIATIWFNRPDKLNAASPQVFKDLDDALTDIEKDDDIRVVILTGKGDAFSAGADVGKFEFDKIIKGVEFIENVAKRTIAYMTLTGATFTAEEAKAVGLVNKVVPHDQLMPEVMKLAEGMKQGAPLAQRMIKRVLNRKCREDWDWTCLMMPTIFSSEDVAESMKALKEKRKPQVKA